MPRVFDNELETSHDVFVPKNPEELELKSVSDVVRPCPAAPP